MNSIYTLKNLYDWDEESKCLGLIGDPIKHSISPQIHNAALAAMPGFKHWRYYKFEIKPEELGEALKLFYSKRFMGLNITIPYKVEVMKYLGSIDQVARKMGAVNTLKRDGKLFKGYNTDGYGMEAALVRDFNMTLQESVVVILGAGGAAKAAAMQCLLADCKAIWIANRSQERLSALLKALGTMGRGKVNVFDLNNIESILTEANILINATSLGMKQEDPLPIDLKKFKPSTLVMDMIYNPSETRLLVQAKEYGMKTTNGVSMLVEQGAKSLEIWTGHVIPVSTMHQVAREVLCQF